MELTDTYKRVLLDQIVVNRSERQRRKLFDDKTGNFLNDDGLVESIKARGVMQPILLDKDNVLWFGERRYTASKLLGLPDIPVRYVEQLSPTEAQIVELEENLCRHDLPWQDECAAITKLHKLYCESHKGWTLQKTIDATNYTQLTEAIRVQRDIGDPNIVGCTSVRQAWNILQRRDDRAMGDALSDILDAGEAAVANVAEPITIVLPDNIGEPRPPTPSGQIVRPPLPPPSTVASTDSILNLSFLEWAPVYTGPKFNLIHCDFPYGRNTFEGKMSGRDRWEHYDDDPQVYQKLIECLCSNLDRIMAYTGHVMFWTSADVEIQHETLMLFRKLAPSLVFNTYPLTWHKTDNVGILPDPKRGPRYVTETAFLASREDRLMIKAVSNAYGAPTDKSHHPSTKPEPMLRYFMQMLVDDATKMLDPTCGSGSSLRAAESLGAAHVLGLEINKEHCDNAQRALRQFRVLRQMTK